MSARKQWAESLKNGNVQALKQWVTTQDDLTGKSKFELTGSEGGPVQVMDVPKEMRDDIMQALKKEFM